MWQNIHGHDDVVERFRQNLRRGRLAGSYLFLGPEGIGKRTFALKLAEALFCQGDDANQLEACGHCDSCLLMHAGNHPDLDTVSLPNGKRDLPIRLFVGEKERRNKEGLCYNVSRRPQMGQRRVAIIDDADHFTRESANCLLKTLEEPPRGAVIILLGTSRGRQLPTILSRTQVVRFSPLDESTVEQLLLSQPLVDGPSQAAELAQACGGSLSKARKLADPELWELRKTLLPQLTPDRLESVRLAKELLAFVSSGDDAYSRRERLRSLLHVVGEHFRAMLRTAAADEELDEETALEALDRCLEAETQLDRNANQATLLECWLDDLAGIMMDRAVRSAH